MVDIVQIQIGSTIALPDRTKGGLIQHDAAE